MRRGLEPAGRAELLFLPALLLLCAGSKNAFIELEAHADESAAASHVVAGQVSSDEADKVVSGGEPHVTNNLVPSFETESVLPRIHPQAAERAGSHSKVPFASDVPGGPPACQLQRSGAGDAR